MYTANPSWCAIIYTYSIDIAAGDDALLFDPILRKFTFEQLDNLLISGSTSTDYVITVRGTAGNDTPVFGEQTFNLKVKNPCIDPAFVSIQTAPLVA